MGTVRPNLARQGNKTNLNISFSKENEKRAAQVDSRQISLGWHDLLCFSSADCDWAAAFPSDLCPERPATAQVAVVAALRQTVRREEREERMGEVGWWRR